METIKTIKAIPEANGRKFFGHFFEFIQGALPTFKNISTLGPVVRFYLLRGENYLISDPVLAEEILLNKEGRFVKNLGFWLRFVDIFGNGLIISEGSHWKRNRRIVAPAFQMKVMHKYISCMLENANGITNQWLDGKVVVLQDEMLKSTARIATQALFGWDLSVEGLEQSLKDIEAQFAHRIRRPFPFQDALPLPSNIRFRRGMKNVEAILAKCIGARRAVPDDTVLSMLIQAVDENGDCLSDRELRDESITLLLAGHDTTAIGLTWALYLLSQHTHYWPLLKSEADALYEQTSIKVEDIFKLKLTLGVIKETLRLYPPAYMIGRMALEDTQIGDFLLPRGKGVVLSPYILGTNPYDFPNPDEFTPERWTDAFEDGLRKGAFIPFGGGPRTCVGDRFAMMEMAVILSSIVRHFRMELIGSAPLPQTSITLLPKAPVRMRLKSIA